MKIAFINQPFDEPYGDQKNSIALWSYRAAKELADHHTVSILCSHFGKEGVVERDGILYRGFDVDADNRRYFLSRFLQLWYRKNKPIFATPWYYPRYYQAIAREIGRGGYDVIHIHNFPQVVHRIRKENPRSTIVLHMHCDWLVQIHRPWMEAVLREVNLVLGCSDHVINGIRKAFPKYAGKCKRLYNGFDSDGFYVMPKERLPEPIKTPYLLYLGRGSPEKGLHLATHAFARIAETFPKLNMVCVGGINPAPKEFLLDLVGDEISREMAPCFEKPYRDYVYDGIPASIRERIFEIPHVDYGNLVGIYQNAEALVVPTVCHEAFGMPVLEAIACGTPVVASRCGGIPEFFMDGKDGYLFERGSLSSLVTQLEKLLSVPVPRRSEQERQNSLTFFSWKTIVSELTGHYDSLVA